MKRSLFIILGALCFAIAGKAQGSDVSVQKKNTGYRILNDTVEAVKDSMTFEQRVEMINRMKLKHEKVEKPKGIPPSTPTYQPC